MGFLGVFGPKQVTVNGQTYESKNYDVSRRRTVGEGYHRGGYGRCIPYDVIEVRDRHTGQLIVRDERRVD